MNKPTTRSSLTSANVLNLSQNTSVTIRNKYYAFGKQINDKVHIHSYVLPIK